MTILLIIVGVWIGCALIFLLDSAMATAAQGTGPWICRFKDTSCKYYKYEPEKEPAKNDTFNQIHNTQKHVCVCAREPYCTSYGQCSEGPCYKMGKQSGASMGYNGREGERYDNVNYRWVKIKSDYSPGFAPKEPK